MNYEIKKLTPFRILSIYGYEALGDGHNMHALIELDVTDLRKRLRSQRMKGQNISFFGFLLSAIGKAIDENKELNHIRCGKKIYYFNEVDIDIPIELKLNGIMIPRKYIVRNAGIKSAMEISQEIDNAKKSWKESGIAGEEDKWSQRWIKIASIIPKWLFKYITKYYANKPLILKKRFGTTYVTSISGFSEISGFAIPFISGKTRPVAFTIGSIVKKPGVVSSEIRIREYLSMTISINHDLVDGAPAARFVNRLKQQIEGNCNN
jgi:pyruvate/2-oxoglutarate dehydrogenase complex dihydrolipoamide acyltransferase (E2) component